MGEIESKMGEYRKSKIGRFPEHKKKQNRQEKKANFVKAYYWYVI